MMRYYIDLKGIGSIMRNPNYTDKEKVLLYIIADHCQFSLNTGKVCELSYSLIKKWTGWGDHTIQNTIASLVKKGDITYNTEQLQGNRKSTAVVSTGYCRNDSNSTVETAVQGTVVAAVNNKQEKQQRNSTIAKDTYSSKCGSDFNDSSCSVAEDTSFVGGSKYFDIKTYLNDHICDGNVMGDLLELAIDTLGWFTNDVQVERVVGRINNNCESVQLDPDFFKDRINAIQEKADRERLTKIIHT